MLHFVAQMSVTDYLGYAKALLDQFGLTGALTAVVIITLAYIVYRRFFGGAD